MLDSKLIEAAFFVRNHAYAPYSNFAVGAAILTSSGNVFLGCNVENISFRLTMCAEQTAVAAAVAGGDKEITTMAIVTDSKEPALPCGACRQALAEFNPKLRIIASTIKGRTQTYQLDELLPKSRQGILERPAVSPD